MEQDQSLGPRSTCHLEGIFGRAVTPIDPAREFLGAVLGVVDEHVDIPTQLDHLVGDGKGTIRGLLMIADVRNRTDRILDAIAVRGSAMRHRRRSDRAATSFDRLRRVGLDKLDTSGQYVEMNREQRRLDETPYLVSERASRLGRADEPEVGPRIEEWFEERDPLNVVPVEVGEQCSTDKSTDALRLEFLAVVTKPRSEVEKDRRLTFGLDHNTRCVPADLTGG